MALLTKFLSILLKTEPTNVVDSTFRKFGYETALSVTLKKAINVIDAINSLF